MTFINRNLKQTVTYWAPAGFNAYRERLFDDPVTILGRWEDNVQLVRSVNGEEVVSKSTVFLASDVAAGGYLALGDLTSEASPQDANAHPIITFTSTPDIRSVSTERKAYV